MYNGKALYNPEGRSGEYARWAVNFFNGCTGGCEYCYNKRFPLLSAPEPTLKACFSDEQSAYLRAIHEIEANRKNIRKDGGLFLSFVSDPCLIETFNLTSKILDYCIPAEQIFEECFNARNDKKNNRTQEQILNELEQNIMPVTILTKQTDWVPGLHDEKIYNHLFHKQDRYLAGTTMAKNIAFGFTLTGHDEMEPGCSTNADRIKAMKILHERGYRTWASIEPIIDFKSSLEMIRLAAPFCDHFKVGLRTDRKFVCTTDELVDFVNGIRSIVNKTGSTVYFKKSFRDIFGGGYIIGTNFVEEGFNMFRQKGPDFKKIFEGQKN